VRVNPVQFTPTSGELELYTHISFTLILEPDSNWTLPVIRRNGLAQLEVERFIRGVIQNDEDVENYLGYGFQTLEPPGGSGGLVITELPSVEGNAVDYVIITSDALQDAFRPLADWKTQKGIVTQIRTVRWIEQRYTGIDVQEKIRNLGTLGSGLDSCCSPATRLTAPGLSPNISAMKVAMSATLPYPRQTARRNEGGTALTEFGNRLASPISERLRLSMATAQGRNRGDIVAVLVPFDDHVKLSCLHRNLLAADDPEPECRTPSVPNREASSIISMLPTYPCPVKPPVFLRSDLSRFLSRS